MQKSHIYTLIIFGIIFLLALQWQISKMNRKLTCIYTQITALPSLLVPELRADQALLQKQMDFVASACHKGYIFSSGSFVPK